MKQTKSCAFCRALVTTLAGTIFYSPELFAQSVAAMHPLDTKLSLGLDK